MTKQTSPTTQQRTLTRRAKIVEIIITTGKTTQSELATELKVSRQTIAGDIAAVTSNGTEWLDGFAAVGWIIMWQGQISTTLKQIKHLEELRDNAIYHKLIVSHQYHDSSIYHLHSVQSTCLS